MHTSARIGLPRAGATIATSEHLAFQLAHAEARDAVSDVIDVATLVQGLTARGLHSVTLKTAAPDRRTYLTRPDLGRRLADGSQPKLEICGLGFDLAVVIADGLSARAPMAHALPFLDQALPPLRAVGWTFAPVAVVEQGRVAIGDEIGRMLQASLVAVVIGERPGLTSPDSLGVYLTWAPRPGLQDATRNCLSNIRPQGMTYREAAQRFVFLCIEAKRRQLTGIALKDETSARPETLPASLAP